MSKMDQFGVLDELAEIKRELVEMRARFDAPLSGQVSRQKARTDCEHPDPTPIELPGGPGGEPPESIQEVIKRYVHYERAQLDDPEVGTFEEEDDFTEEDTDQLPLSMHEITEYELEEDPDMPPAQDASELEEPNTPATGDPEPTDPVAPDPPETPAAPPPAAT